MFIPLYDENSLKSIPFQFVTLTIIAVNVALYLVQSAGMDFKTIASFAVIPTDLVAVNYVGGPAMGPLDRFAIPEWATLVSYMFFHGDFFHLLGNMLFLWVFGDNVEDALGHFKFLIFYCLCGVAGAVVHAAVSTQSGTPLIGASAGVAGVIAAYLMLHPRVGVWILVMRVLPLKISAAWALGFWILVQVAMVLIPQVGPIAWWAHIGGLVAGALLVLVMRRPGVALFDRDLKKA